MRARYLFLLITLFFIGNFSPNYLSANPMKNDKPLILKGEMDLIRTRSLPDYDPILVFQTDNAILIEITTPIGRIDVKILGNNGIVYSNSMNFTNPTQFVIFTSEYTPGEYLLEFSDENGGCLYTEFTIE